MLTGVCAVWRGFGRICALAEFGGHLFPMSYDNVQVDIRSRIHRITETIVSSCLKSDRLVTGRQTP